jgi:hypothetical protein
VVLGPLLLPEQQQGPVCYDFPVREHPSRVAVNEETNAFTDSLSGWSL